MKRPEFIARQAANPQGIVGRVIAQIMSWETSALNVEAVALLGVAQADRVLEVGFAHGLTVERIAAAAPEGFVAGVDVSESMTRVAASRNRRAVNAGRVELRTGTSASLPFDDAVFDKALAVHTVYFWNDVPTHLRELRRVLRPGARFVLAFTPSTSARAEQFPASVYTFYDEPTLLGMLAAAGFSETEVRHVGEAVLVATQVRR